MTTHINTNLKKCSCQGLNSNCYMCYGKGWIDDGIDFKVYSISSKFENSEDICWEIEIYIQRKQYNLARKLLNENKNKLMKNSYDQLIIKCNEKDKQKNE